MSSDMPEVAGVSHRWVEARGLRFHVADAGEGDDVVLCLHGWPQHWYEWRHLLPALAASGHRALAVDLRGFGWSDAPADGYEKENLATDVLAVLDALGLRRVKLVAHDWGAWVGFLLCLREPGRFERYLALNMLPPWVETRKVLPHAWRFAYQWMIISPGLGYRLHTSGRFVPKVLVGASARREAWDQATLRAFADNLAQPDRARACVQLYRVFNLREAAGVARGRYARQRLTVPTRMLFGTEDPALRPELVDTSQRHAEDMRLERVEDCGHFIADERPDLVAERAREFLAP
ncbi:MAG TPA: alpha/beta hydrolase [Solirubrobacterales bacterium]|nr:alpha/beta hydrolase [Solirubrobacterales bacterium]